LTQGSQGAQGAQGNPGPVGPNGIPGATGAQGATGTGGDSGAQGAQGASGGQGAQGSAGPPGVQGSQGAQGAQGNQGRDGVASGPSGAQGAQGDIGSPSDKRLKDNIVKLENVLNTTKKIDGVTFVWNYEHTKIKDNKSIAVKEAFEGKAIGVIAQQVEEVVPSIVFTDDDGYKSVNYGLMVSLGIGSVQEQQHRINSIYERINNLKNKISG
jgi:hypothetical protein